MANYLTCRKFDFLIYKMGLELTLGLKFRLIVIENLVSDLKDVQ